MDKLYATSWGKQLVDHIGHIILGFAVTLPLINLPYEGIHTFLVAGMIACLAGFSRELAQMQKAKRGWVWDRTIDTLFHLPGGLVVGGLSQWLA